MSPCTGPRTSPVPPCRYCAARPRHTDHRQLAARRNRHPKKWAPGTAPWRQLGFGPRPTTRCPRRQNASTCARVSRGDRHPDLRPGRHLRWPYRIATTARDQAAPGRGSDPRTATAMTHPQRDTETHRWPANPHPASGSLTYSAAVVMSMIAIAARPTPAVTVITQAPGTPGWSAVISCAGASAHVWTPRLDRSARRGWLARRDRSPERRLSRPDGHVARRRHLGSSADRASRPV